MGKKKLNEPSPSCDFNFSKHGLENLESLYPTLLKVAGSNEFPLLDLSSIQMDLEQILASVVERIICLKAESKGKDLPVNIISLKYQKGSSEPESNPQYLSKSSLVVKANPDKPLTLIISQRSGPCPNSQSMLPAISSGIGRVKPSVTAFGLRRSSRSSVEETPEPSSPTSPDKNQLSASYAIPNKFWELMEPYCAEITEANVNYLESLIRSYQHLESIYFHLPVLKQSDLCKNETSETPAYKRLRRGSSHIFQQEELLNSSNNCNSHMSASQLLNVTKYLETELKKPVPESSMLSKVSQSLLESCYRDDVLSNFSGKLNFPTHKENHEVEDNNSGCTDPNGSDYGSLSTEALHVNGYNNNNTMLDSHVTNYSSLGSTTLTHHHLLTNPNVLTARASEPLKSIAKQLRVSSSYRVEKRIAQAIDELGLFPLSVLHPKVSPSMESKKPDCNSHNLSSTSIYYNDSVSLSTKLIIRKNKISSLNSSKSNNNSLMKHSNTVVPSVLEKNHIFKKRRMNSEKSLSPLPEHQKNTTCESNKLDTEHSTELSLSSVKMENVDPISNANNHNNNNDQIKSTCCYSKKLKRKNLKISKSICYRNKLRNTVNSNSNNSTTTTTTTTTTTPTQNEILCNGITSNLNDSIESKQWDCVPTSRHDLNLPTTDTEYFSDKDNPPGKHDLHISVSGRNRNTLTTQLSMENEKRLTTDSTNPTKQTHHSLKHNNHFSSNNLSESHCNEGINSPFASLENHESIVMNGDLTLCEFHNDKLIDNDELCDKSNGHCNNTNNNNFEENCEATQVLNSNLHNPLNQNNEQCTTTPLQNSQHKFKLESNLLEKTSYKTDHLTGKTNHHASPMIQPNDPKLSDCGVNTVLFGEDSSSSSTTTTTTTTTQYGSSTSDDIGWAIVQRQRELRLLCTANHRMLRRLIQAARRDMQRQEILRRLAIADADVIEAYNKLESYRPYRKPPLKRDRDLSWKALKERRKILKELEAFDAKSP